MFWLLLVIALLLICHHKTKEHLSMTEVRKVVYLDADLIPVSQIDRPKFGHQEIYRQLIYYQIPAAVVIDKNVNLDPRFWMMISALRNHISFEWDMVYLAIAPIKVPQFVKLGGLNKCDHTFGYVLSNKGAAKMIRVMDALVEFKEPHKIAMDEYCLVVPSKLV